MKKLKEPVLLTPSKNNDLKNPEDPLWNVLQDTATGVAGLVKSAANFLRPSSDKRNKTRAINAQPKPKINKFKTEPTGSFEFKVHPLERAPKKPRDRKRYDLQSIREMMAQYFYWDGWDETVDRVLGNSVVNQDFLKKDVTEWCTLDVVRQAGFLEIPPQESKRPVVANPLPCACKERLWVYAPAGAECFDDQNVASPKSSRKGDNQSEHHSPRVAKEDGKSLYSENLEKDERLTAAVPASHGLVRKESDDSKESVTQRLAPSSYTSARSITSEGGTATRRSSYIRKSDRTAGAAIAEIPLFLQAPSDSPIDNGTNTQVNSGESKESNPEVIEAGDFKKGSRKKTITENPEKMENRKSSKGLTKLGSHLTRRAENQPQIGEFQGSSEDQL